MTAAASVAALAAVVCDDYTTTWTMTVAEAEQLLAAGFDHCPLEHHLQYVVADAGPAFPRSYIYDEDPPC